MYKALFNEKFCQICDRFTSKELWNKHLYSSRHLHREVNGNCSAFFPQRKLTRDEGIKLENVFLGDDICNYECVEVYDFFKNLFQKVY